MAFSPIFPDLPARLGVYNLTKRLGALERSELYLATQTHVERHVIIEVLRPEASGEEASLFVTTARKRVANQLPHTTKVLESMVSDGIWYITQELPPGSMLPERAASDPPTVGTLCEIIRDAAELYLAAQQENLAVLPVTAQSIYLSRLKGIHFLSPVIEGEGYTYEMEAHCMQQLSLLLAPYVPENVPGHTRICTLLEWLYQGYQGQMLDWNGIHQTAKTILRQLDPTGQADDLRKTVKVYDANSDLRKQSRQRRRLVRSLAMAGACLLAVGIMSQMGRLFATSDAEVISPLTSGYILAKQGRETVQIMRRPVSINEYAHFLSCSRNLSAEELERINRDIPENARDHTPADWADMYQSATQGWTWNNKELSLQSPIIGISYWDALAYARYAGGSLPPANLLQQASQLAPVPTAEEWTGSHISNDPVTGDCCIVLNSQDSTPKAEYNINARNTERTFRIMRPRGSSHKSK